MENKNNSTIKNGKPLDKDTIFIQRTAIKILELHSNVVRLIIIMSWFYLVYFLIPFNFGGWYISLIIGIGGYILLLGMGILTMIEARCYSLLKKLSKKYKIIREHLIIIFLFEVLILCYTSVDALAKIKELITMLL